MQQYKVNLTTPLKRNVSFQYHTTDTLNTLCFTTRLFMLGKVKTKFDGVIFGKIKMVKTVQLLCQFSMPYGYQKIKMYANMNLVYLNLVHLIQAVKVL